MRLRCACFGPTFVQCGEAGSWEWIPTRETPAWRGEGWDLRPCHATLVPRPEAEITPGVVTDWRRPPMRATLERFPHLNVILSVVLRVTSPLSSGVFSTFANPAFRIRERLAP